MSCSCHLDNASNVEIGVECQIFVVVFFFNFGRVLQFGAYSRYYKGAIAQKRSFSDLYYFQLEISKQTFNTKFVIRRAVQMT